MTNLQLIDRLGGRGGLTQEEWIQLIDTHTPAEQAYAAEIARAIALDRFGKRIYFRGIVEFSNYCKNDCYYCGIRRSSDAVRYRLEQADILDCCREGYALGFRTFVLQSGEDPWYTDARMIAIISAIRSAFPDCAITLSIGERSRESYQAYFDAGANRFLLRHETADCAHYAKLHPACQTLENRMRCLWDLRDIGYQTGCGFMVGSPGQTLEDVARDLEFIRQFGPEMVGIGPFIPHRDTPLGAFPAGTVEMTCKLLAIIRLLLPDALLPATTALAVALRPAPRP